MGGSINDLVPELQDAAAALLDAAGAARLQPRITSTVRTRSEQGRLYRRFLAGAAGFPVAPPGFSAHEYGEAFDMVVSPMEALADVGYTWRQWGGAWNPGDAVHFELPGASERAKSRGREAANDSPTGLSVSDWLLQEYNAIPWWISFLLPAGTTTQAATSQKTTYLRSLIQKYGL
jgi:hypothetical protein